MNRRATSWFTLQYLETSVRSWRKNSSLVDGPLTFFSALKCHLHFDCRDYCSSVLLHLLVCFNLLDLRLNIVTKENSGFLIFTVPQYFRNLIKMWYFFPQRHCHIFLWSWHLIWRWQTGRCTVLWQICRPWIDLCSTHSNIQACFLATYHQSCFTSLLIDFLRAKWQRGDGCRSVPHCHS